MRKKITPVVFWPLPLRWAVGLPLCVVMFLWVAASAFRRALFAFCDHEEWENVAWACVGTVLGRAKD